MNATAENPTNINLVLDVPVSLTASTSGAGTQGASKQMNFDEKLNIARTAVTADPKRVAQVVRDMVGTDG